MGKVTLHIRCQWIYSSQRLLQLITDIGQALYLQWAHAACLGAFVPSPTLTHLAYLPTRHLYCYLVFPAEVEVPLPAVYGLEVIGGGGLFQSVKDHGRI